MRRALLTARVVTFLLAVCLAGLATAAPALGDVFSLHVPVLMYHRISRAPADAAIPGLWVSPRHFRQQLAALKRHGWRTITAEQLGHALRDHRRVGRKRFVITIDDGARDGWANAAPILEKLDMHATFCVVPGRAGKPWQLSWRHMRRLREAGHEIANHSLTHRDLTTLSLAELHRQVDKARRLIRERVGHAPRTFCYPFGHQNATVRAVVADAGHLIAFTTVSGTWHSTSDPIRSPRVRVNGSDTPLDVLARLGG